MKKQSGGGWWHQHASRQTAEPVDAAYMAEQRELMAQERAREQAERAAKAAKHGMTLAEYDAALNKLWNERGDQP